MIGESEGVFLPRVGVVILGRLSMLCLLAAADAEESGEDVHVDTVNARIRADCSAPVLPALHDGGLLQRADPGTDLGYRLYALTATGREAVRAIREARAPSRPS